jgi:hypothetical protein
MKSTKNGGDDEEEGEVGATCAGFDENVVLAVKACFLDSEMRCLIILRSSSRNKYIYHSRTCPSLAR